MMMEERGMPVSHIIRLALQKRRAMGGYAKVAPGPTQD